MDEQQLDLDWLAQLLTVVKDAEVTEFTFGPLTVRFGAPAPATESQEHPTRPEVQSPRVNAPAGYAALLPPRAISGWPKADQS